MGLFGGSDITIEKTNDPSCAIKVTEAHKVNNTKIVTVVCANQGGQIESIALNSRTEAPGFFAQLKGNMHAYVATDAGAAVSLERDGFTATNKDKTLTKEIFHQLLDGHPDLKKAILKSGMVVHKDPNTGESSYVLDVRDKAAPTQVAGR